MKLQTSGNGTVSPARPKCRGCGTTGSFGHPGRPERSIPAHRPQDAGTCGLPKPCPGLGCHAGHLHPSGPPLRRMRGEMPELCRAASRLADKRVQSSVAALASPFLQPWEQSTIQLQKHLPELGCCCSPKPTEAAANLSCAKVKTAHSHGRVTRVFHIAIMSLLLAFRSSFLLKLHFLLTKKYPELPFTEYFIIHDSF